MSIASSAHTRMVLGFTGQNGQVFNVVHHAAYDIGASVDEADLIALVDGAYSAIANPFMDLCDDTITWNDIQVYVRNYTLNLWDNIGVAVIGAAGRVVGNAQPPQIATGVRLYTENVRVTGHSYWPAPTTGFVAADGTMTAVHQTNAAAAFGNLVSGYSGPLGALAWGVWSVKLNDFYQLTGVAVDQTFDTQRRRKLEVGI